MTRGIYRTKNGWADDDSVCVRYPDGLELEIPRIQYVALINNPAFESLPWATEYENFQARIVGNS